MNALLNEVSLRPYQPLGKTGTWLLLPDPYAGLWPNKQLFTHFLAFTHHSQSLHSTSNISNYMLEGIHDAPLNAVCFQTHGIPYSSWLGIFLLPLIILFFLSK